MTTIDVDTGDRFSAVMDMATYNKISGVSFARWGLIHVVSTGSASPFSLLVALVRCLSS